MIRAVTQVLYYTGGNQPRRARAFDFFYLLCYCDELQRQDAHIRDPEKKCFQAVLKS